jgi:hypothetical protein
VNEFLAITAMLASTAVATQACTTSDSNATDDDAGSTGGSAGTGGSSSGGSAGDTDGSAGSSTGGTAPDAGADGAIPDGSVVTEGGVTEGGGATDGAVACWGDETTLAVPDGGVEGFTFCADLPEAFCADTLLDPIASVCSRAELFVRPGVLEALIGCLRTIELPAGDAGDAGAACDASVQEAAVACWNVAIDGACPSPTVPVDASSVGLDCEAVHDTCDGVSIARCEVASGALNEEGRANQFSCFDFFKDYTDCVDAFETCLTDPFAE